MSRFLLLKKLVAFVTICILLGYLNRLYSNDSRVNNSIKVEQVNYNLALKAK